MRRETTTSRGALATLTRSAIVVLGLVSVAAAADEPTAEQLGAWRQELADGSSAERVAACESLGRSYPGAAEAVPLLVAALGDDDDRVRSAADAAIETLNGRAMDRLAEWLGEDGASQRAFDEAVGGTLERGQRMTPKDLAQAVRSSPSPGWAVAALGMWSARRSPYEMYALFLGAGPPDSANGKEMRTCALAGAGGAMLDTKAVRPVPERLLALVTHEGALRRWGAACLLANCRTTDKTKEALTRLKGDTDRRVALAAKAALVALGPEETARPDAGPPPVPLELQIASLEEAPDPRVRLGRAWALPPPPKSVDPALRRRALLALVKTRQREGLPFLVDPAFAWLLSDGPGDETVARETANRLAEVLEASAAVLAKHVDLVAGIASEGWLVGESYRQRYLLLDALGRMGPAAKEAKPVIEPLTSSPDLLLRYLARRALRQLERP